MKKKPCEFCEVEQFITINGKDAQMSIEFYPDSPPFSARRVIEVEAKGDVLAVTII